MWGGAGIGCDSLESEDNPQPWGKPSSAAWGRRGEPQNHPGHVGHWVNQSKDAGGIHPSLLLRLDLE